MTMRLVRSLAVVATCLAGSGPSEVPASPPRDERVQGHLNQIEALLLAQRWDDAKRAVDAFVRRHRHTEWAPAAVLLLGRYLEAAKKYQEAIEVLRRAHRMYGCAARDDARELRNQIEWDLQRERMSAARDRELARKLAPTAPRAGLSPQEEIRRQDERARALLIRATGEHGNQITHESVPYLEQLIRECPDSGYRPFAELALPMARWGGRHELALRYALDDVVEPMGAAFQTVAEKYSHSFMGQAADVMIASLIYMMGDLRGAYREAKKLLVREPPDPEPYPLSVEALGKTDWHMAPYIEPTYDIRALMEVVTGDLIGVAFRERDLELARELADYARKTNQESGDAWWVKISLGYFGDEPEALRRLAPLYALELGGQGRPMSASDIERLAMEVVQEHPRSKAAPAALWCAIRGLPRRDRDPAAAEAAERLRTVLATKYPDSVENLGLLVSSLTREKRYDEALAVLARIEKMKADPAASEAVRAYVRHVTTSMRNPGESKRWHEKRIAELRSQYGAWLDKAGLDDEYLATYPDTSAVIEKLVRRLPENELDIIATTRDHPAPRGTDVEVLGRRPRRELALELLWRRADADSLLALLAAGVDAPHFDEAIQRWRVVMYRNRLYTPDPVSHYRELADEHSGTPAEALALDAAARTYLQDERPEQALDFLNASLHRIARGRMFRDHLLATRKIARRQIATKRHAKVQLLWEFAPPGDDVRFFTQEPIAADGRIYVRASIEHQGDQVLCLNGDTGGVLWRRPVREIVMMRLAGRRLLVGTRDARLICLDALSGEQLWLKRLPGSGDDGLSCAAGDGVAAAHARRGPLCALDAGTGDILWDQPGDWADRPPTVLSHIVTAWDRDGVLHARRLTDGTEIWAWNLHTLALPEDEGNYADPELAAPTIRGGHLLTFDAYRYRTLTALDPRTGEAVWTKRLRMIPDVKLRSAASDENQVILAGRDITIACDTLDGSFLWAAPLPRGKAYMQDPLARAGDLLFRAMWGGVLALDLRLGAPVTTLEGVLHPTGLAAQQTRSGVRLYCVGFHGVRAWHVRLPHHRVPRGPRAAAEEDRHLPRQAAEPGAEEAMRPAVAANHRPLHLWRTPPRPGDDLISPPAPCPGRPDPDI